MRNLHSNGDTMQGLVLDAIIKACVDINAAGAIYRALGQEEKEQKCRGKGMYNRDRNGRSRDERMKKLRGHAEI